VNVPGFTFKHHGRTYRIVHGRDLEEGMFLSSAHETAYHPVEVGEARAVLEGLLHEPSWRIRELGMMVDGMRSPTPWRATGNIVARVRDEVRRPVSALQVFVRVDVGRSLPRSISGVPIEDLLPWAPEEPRDGRLLVSVRRRGTREYVPGVLVRVGQSATCLAEKSSLEDAESIDFGTYAPGSYDIEVVLRDEQEEAFEVPAPTHIELAAGERRHVEILLEPDTTFEVLFHDREHDTIPGAPFRVLDHHTELLVGEADDRAVGRFKVPSASTTALTLEWSETCEDGETYVLKFFIDTTTVREELERARLQNLGYPWATGIDHALGAFARDQRVGSEQGSSKLDDVFQSKELG